MFMLIPVKIQGGINMEYGRICRKGKRLRRFQRKGISVLLAALGTAVILLMSVQVAMAMLERPGSVKVSGMKADIADMALTDTQEDAETGQAETGKILAEDPLLLLVNKTHALPKDHTVDLVETGSKGIYVDKACAQALSQMLEDARAEGLDLVIASGYRSSERQQEILEEDTQDYMDDGMSYEMARQKAMEQVMPPGYSEHETGLAVDIAAAYHQQLDEEQAMTPENQWLREHCTEYGFILRYPADKEAITGITYESWHFRYVGVQHAKAMTEADQTLEEYLGETD